MRPTPPVSSTNILAVAWIALKAGGWGSCRPMSDAEWHVASSQQMVQSFYQEADRALRHGEVAPQTPSSRYIGSSHAKRPTEPPLLSLAAGTRMHSS